MNFGQALEKLKEGYKVQRSGWNDKGMWLVLVPGSVVTVVEGRPLAKIFPIGKEINYHPHVDMKGTDESIFVWNPNQLDMLANDWSTLT